EIMCQWLRQKGVNLLSLTIVYGGRLSFVQDFAKSIVSHLRQKEIVRKIKLAIVIVAYNSNIQSFNINNVRLDCNYSILCILLIIYCFQPIVTYPKGFDNPDLHR
ncbi:hypothetical protein RYX36_022615, partial [Vicia faba]